MTELGAKHACCGNCHKSAELKLVTPGWVKFVGNIFCAMATMAVTLYLGACYQFGDFPLAIGVVIFVACLAVIVFISAIIKAICVRFAPVNQAYFQNAHNRIKSEVHNL